MYVCVFYCEWLVIWLHLSFPFPVVFVSYMLMRILVPCRHRRCRCGCRCDRGRLNFLNGTARSVCGTSCIRCGRGCRCWRILISGCGSSCVATCWGWGGCCIWRNTRIIIIIINDIRRCCRGRGIIRLVEFF